MYVSPVSKPAVGLGLGLGLDLCRTVAARGGQSGVREVCGCDWPQGTFGIGRVPEERAVLETLRGGEGTAFC
jgi:hypothetical protein